MQCDPDLAKKFRQSAESLKQRFDTKLQLRKRKDELLAKRLRGAGVMEIRREYKVHNDWLDKLSKDNDGHLRDIPTIVDLAKQNINGLDELKQTREDQERERAKLEK